MRFFRLHSYLQRNASYTLSTSCIDRLSYHAVRRLVVLRGVQLDLDLVLCGQFEFRRRSVHGLQMTI